MNAEHQLTVYEAVNAAEQELLIGITERKMAVLIASHRIALPPIAAHWRGEPSYRSLEFGLAPEQARAFALRYAESRAREGWRVLLVD